MKETSSIVEAYAGILNFQGELLLIKQGKVWELPGGRVEIKTTSYGYLMKEFARIRMVREVARIVEEQVDIQIPTKSMPSVYFIPFKSPEGKCELVGLVLIMAVQEPKRGETKYASPLDLEMLVNRAERREEERLSGGYDGKTHRMALIALSHSSNFLHRRDARVILREIKETAKRWFKKALKRPGG